MPLRQYLGPSAAQMGFLFVLAVTNSITLLAIGLLLARNLWCLGANVTTIDGWEIERHKSLVRRARIRGGYLDGPDGVKIMLKKHEFPYDIGILKNINQGMGGSPLLWMWPLASTPSNDSGLAFETNGFGGRLPRMSLCTSIVLIILDGFWPPPDPDRMPKQELSGRNRAAFTHDEANMTTEEQVAGFRRRQEEDLKRFDGGNVSAVDQSRLRMEASKSKANYILDGHGWRDSEGERLDDFGVDEAVDFYDEDEIPLAELKRRRRKRTD